MTHNLDRAQPKGFETPEQFASRLGISTSRVLGWIRDGILPAVRLGNLVLVPEDALQRKLDEGERWSGGVR